MKPSVAITLITGGVVLICLPPLADCLHQLYSVRVLEAVGSGASVTLSGKLDSQYRLGCFVVGGLMIAVAALATMRAPHDPRP